LFTTVSASTDVLGMSMIIAYHLHLQSERVYGTWKSAGLPSKQQSRRPVTNNKNLINGDTPGNIAGPR
jgi:hypothetical protein